MGRWARALARDWKSHLGTLAVVAAVFFGVQAWQTRHVPGGAAPDLALELLQADGSTRSTTLAQWRAEHPGRAVALHVWADWCPICRTEEGSVTALGKDHPVLTIAMQSGPGPAVASVLAQRALPWTTAVDTRADAARALGVHAVPAFIVIDADGQLRAPTVGYTSEIGMRWRLWWARRWPTT